jgi:HEAT repeat protein
MGLLDFLFGGSSQERQLEKLEDTLTNMYKQDSERRYAIQDLRDMRSPEAVEVLLTRFGETAPNTTIDAEEKEFVYDVLVELGQTTELDIRGQVIEHLKETDEKINWPMKVLTDLLDYDEMADVIAELLDTCTTGFKRNPEKKQELMLQATEVRSERLAEKLVPFLDDANETIRFLAVDAVAHQGYEDIIKEPLRQRLVDEDSFRIIKKIVEVFLDHQGWTIPEEAQPDVERALPEEFGIHKEGHIYRRRV